MLNKKYDNNKTIIASKKVIKNFYNFLKSEIYSGLISYNNSNFFKNVSVDFNENNLVILVEENPIIENVVFNGIKSKTLKSDITKDNKLKPRSSFNEVDLLNDKNIICLILLNFQIYYQFFPNIQNLHYFDNN